MNGDKTIQAIQELTMTDRISPEASSRLMLSILAEHHEALSSIQKDTGEIRKTLASTNITLEKLSVYTSQNPPLLWLLRYKTKITVVTIIGILFLLNMLDAIRVPLLQFLGLPVF